MNVQSSHHPAAAPATASHPTARTIEAVILDWAGTTMDFGCMAPVAAFVKAFEKSGVPISVEEARTPMGAHKRVHIQKILKIPAVQARWQEIKGAPSTEADVDVLFADFVPLQLQCLSDYSALIPGTLETVSALRERGLKIGTTTGFTTEMMEINRRDAEAQGYAPDVVVCASEVPAGRPYPYMCLTNAVELGVTSVQACIKVDDTIPGIEEGLTAGMWTVGLAVSGNEVGLSLEDWQALPTEEQATTRDGAHARMQAAGAHYVIDSIADLVPVIDEISRRAAAGERP